MVKSVAMSPFEYDLLVRASRVVCPVSGIDGPAVVAVKGDRIAAVGPDVVGTARQTLDFSDSILLPGLIDLHAHPAIEGSKYGVPPDQHLLSRGTTTVLSQGDAGATNWPQYLEATIRRSHTRVLMAINLSTVGESTEAGCLENLEDADVDACSATILQGGRHIWGIAVNLSRYACGETNPRTVMHRAILVAEQTGRPLLYGMRETDDWPLVEQMKWLRAGDVVTYCFRPSPRSILVDGHIHPAVLEARQRGVLFDVGHGFASFSFSVAQAALTAGFAPDSISTDFYANHIDAQPPHDLPRTMSKLLAVGMQQSDVFAAVTSRPARILGLEGEIGRLTVGACADLTVLRFQEQAEPLIDTEGQQLAGGCWQAIAVKRGESEMLHLPIENK